MEFYRRRDPCAASAEQVGGESVPLGLKPGAFGGGGHTAEAVCLRERWRKPGDWAVSGGRLLLFGLRVAESGTSGAKARAFQWRGITRLKPCA
jgi:hypothetical protein